MAPQQIQQALRIALEHQQAGRLPQAEAAYRNILRAAPEQPDALHFLGILAHQTGNSEMAVQLIRHAIRSNPANPVYQLNLGTIYPSLNKGEEALACFRQALVLKPDLAEAHAFMGNLLQDLGRLAEALPCYRRAIACRADFAEAHNNLGAALQEQGQVDEAMACFNQALSLKPDFAEAHFNLGTALQEQGRLEQAELELAKAIAINPRYHAALLGLSSLALAQGAYDQALAAVLAALRIEESNEARQAFVACIRQAEFVTADAEIRQLLVRALSEPWGRPRDLGAVSRSMISANPEIKACLDRAMNAWPTRLAGADLFGASGLATMAAEPLLRCLLENVQVADPAYERLLTMTRRTMLAAARHTAIAEQPEEALLSFYCALGRQCFINDFVYSATAEEQQQAVQLRLDLGAKIESANPFPVLWLAAVAAYFPLSSLPAIDTVLDRSWPQAVAALLLQQVAEPAKERGYRAGLRRLTEVDDEVSLSVQRQYEENPYPRWVKFPSGGRAYGLQEFFSRRFPHVPLRPLPAASGIDILIAGCGTGQHALSTAQQFLGARVLAVDLSATSLCYAKRKTAEIGLQNIEYAQADIMKLGSFERRFEVIESVGVLHHLADPMAGWRILLSLLKPGGMMLLGLYSELARQDIVAARQFIADRGYAATAEDIRRCRQELMSMSGDSRFKQLTARPDFFGTSECRDLLFNVQEHRTSLPAISEMLASLGLNFIGFNNLGQDAVDRYGRRFPDDKAMTDLDSWHIFEAENADVFVGMYQFWVQKT